MHLLPFFPYTSDDGFSVVDYRKVDEGQRNVGGYPRLGEDVELVFDLVINHASPPLTSIFENFLLIKLRATSSS